ncbi:E3 ubiquitin-protein ligase RHA2A [Linum grandiflorum]
MEEWDEIRELSCRHLFHRGCLDRWSHYFTRRPTCPLCRRSLSASGSHRSEVLVFRFADVFFSDDISAKDTWWLR